MQTLKRIERNILTQKRPAVYSIFDNIKVTGKKNNNLSVKVLLKKQQLSVDVLLKKKQKTFSGSVCHLLGKLKADAFGASTLYDKHFFSSRKNRNVLGLK